jgi:RNA polymerase-binding transcription factor DksA
MAATKKTPSKTTAKQPAKKAAATARKTAKKAAAAPRDRQQRHDRQDGQDRHPDGIPAPRGKTKEGIVYTKDFDVRFLKAQHDALLAERQALLGQANRLEDEANSLIEDGEMGDVQFDDESGEGDTMVVERERDLALSAQARQTIADIDAALERMTQGTYGYSLVSGLPIPRERLEAIPWATVLVEEKVGGIGRR